MKHPIGRRITALWKGLLSQREKEFFGADLEKDQEDLKQELERSFFEEVSQQKGLLTDREYADLLDEVHRKMGVPVRKPRRRIKTWTAAAAIVLLIGVAGLIFKWQMPVVQTTQVLTANSAQGVNDPIKLCNTTDQDRTARLKDGSRVTLASGAELTFSQQYGKSERVLHLRGRAKFEVAHDTARPFVVWTDTYSTTALGTVFLIDAKAEDQINIALLSGKIVVKKAPNSGLDMEDQYLLAGDQLTINRHSEVVILAPARRVKPTGNVKKVVQDSINKKPSLRFMDAPLRSVFDSIAVRKQVRITTENLELDGLTFSGEFTESETAVAMVRVICQMNNLQCEETANGLIISQKTPTNQTILTEIKNQTTNK